MGGRAVLVTGLQVLASLAGLGSAESFVPFTTFLNKVERASYNDHRGGLASPAEFDKMRTHILYMYEGVRDPASITSMIQEDAYVDCIPILEQPSAYHSGLKEIPKSSPAQTSHEGEGSSPDQGFRTPDGKESMCPEGTIPMLRLTLQRMTKFRTLQDFFGKGPHGTPAATAAPSACTVENNWDPQHLYAETDQNVPNHGGYSYLSVWKPTGDFSISQVWYAGGSGCDLQTVEGGWIVYPEKFSTQPSVFIYYTNHNYGQGNCATPKPTGCYNLDCPGFMQTDRSVVLGGPVGFSSTVNGPQRGYGHEWLLKNQRWVLRLVWDNGTSPEIGYYDGSYFNGGQLSRNAQEIAFGGETTKRLCDAWPQMGSGQLAERGIGQAASQRNIVYYADERGVGIVPQNLGHSQGAAPDCYSFQWDQKNAFYFGGPGSAYPRDCSRAA